MSSSNPITTARPAIPDGHADQLAKRVEELERNLDNLMESVGHDLRTPLRIAAGYLVMLEEDHGASLAADARQLLDVISTQINRMDELLMSLVALSEAGRQMLDCQQVDMTLLVKEAAATESDGVRVTLEIEPLGQACCDRGMLSQVWRALLNNAVKFSAAVGDPQITISCTPGDGETVYCIRDNGIGFDIAYSRNVFEPCVQSHCGNLYGGSGYGLALVRCLVERHGGRTWIDSTPHQGTCCYFSLPAGAGPKA